MVLLYIFYKKEHKILIIDFIFVNHVEESHLCLCSRTDIGRWTGIDRYRVLLCKVSYKGKNSCFVLSYFFVYASHLLNVFPNLSSPSFS